MRQVLFAESESIGEGAVSCELSKFADNERPWDCVYRLAIKIFTNRWDEMPAWETRKLRDDLTDSKAIRWAINEFDKVVINEFDKVTQAELETCNEQK